MENNNAVGFAPDDEMSLKYIILKFLNWYKFIITKWIPILVIGAIFGAIGLSYSIIKKPIYTAALSFALDDNKSGGGLGVYSGLASQFGLDISGGGGGAFSGDNIIELMKSRTIVKNVLLTVVNVKGKHQTLVEHYIDFNQFRNQWSDKPNLANIHFLSGCDTSKLSLQQDSLLAVFYNNIILNNLTVTKPDKKLSIIVVGVSAKSELFSKYFAEILVSKVSQFYIETKTKKANQNVKILQHQTDSIRRELNLAINGVASNIDVNPNPNPGRQILKAPAQHRQVDVQVNSAILAELVKNLEMAKVSLRNETPLIQIIDRPTLPLKKDKLSNIAATIGGIITGMCITLLIITWKRIFQDILSR